MRPTRGLICTGVLVVELSSSGCKFGGSHQPTTPQGDTGNAVTHVRAYGETYGNDGVVMDRFDAIRTTNDGGYIVAGTGGTPTTDLVGNKMWVLRTNPDGSVAWQYRFVRGNGEGGLTDAAVNALALTSDGGCVVAGRVGVDALVIKLNGDGTKAWEWRVHGERIDEVLRNETFALDVMPDGTILVAGGYAASRYSGGPFTEMWSWVVPLHADGTLPDPQPAFVVYQGGWPDAIVATNDGGYLVVGHKGDVDRTTSAADTWAARFHPYPARQLFDLGWLKSYGAGQFRALARAGDGFILAGLGAHGPLVYELAADGSLTAAHEFRAPDGGETSPLIVRKANAIRVTDDGYLLAGTYGDGHYSGFAWAAKVIKGSGTSHTIEWQNNYVGAGYGRYGYPEADATAIDAGVNGGYRLAGRLFAGNSVVGAYDTHGLIVDSSLAWVLDVAPGGAIRVNPVSGVYALATNLSAVETTATVPVADLDPDLLEFFSNPAFEGISGGSFVAAESTQAIIETMSGPSGVLSTPVIGSNDPGDSFYWTGVPEATGFILYRSADSVTYTRNEDRFDYGYDYYGTDAAFDSRPYFKVVAFNASGYSDYSIAVGLSLGRMPAPEPGSPTLTVVVSGGDGYVVSVSTTGASTCYSRCVQVYATSAGTQVTLTPAEVSAQFSSWQGCDSVSGKICTVVMTDHDRTVMAIYHSGTPDTPR